MTRTSTLALQGLGSTEDKSATPWMAGTTFDMALPRGFEPLLPA